MAEVTDDTILNIDVFYQGNQKMSMEDGKCTVERGRIDIPGKCEMNGKYVKIICIIQKQICDIY